ncbi:MAG: hypothetical protein J6T52_01100 [Bacteroidaceae bacterium]|nr:hypothetical protein [Bacteroidaceae bacterium]
MKKVFQIIEKIVYGIAALAIVLVVIMMVYGTIANTQLGWQKIIPYLYLAAFLLVIYKALVIIFTSFYKIQITKRQEYLDAIKGIGGEGGDVILNQKEDQNKELEAIFDAVKQTPQADTDSIVSTLRERLPEVVQDLVTQQVELEKKRLAQENEKRLNEINALSTDVSGVIERRDYLLKLEREIKRQEAENRVKRLKYTEEYTMLVFSLAGTPVEDVEKVCDVVKLFIETGQVAANKDLRIPLNKKLRNAEVKQFVYNIIRYNGKENLDAESFLQTAFGEWFSGKKENIAKNYSVLPKDSLVSKDGVEADLERLRKRI